MDWTEEQDDALREASYRGAAFAAAELERRFGIHRSVAAVKMRASRIRCSLMEQTVCPECGAVGVALNKQTGLCRRCTIERHIAEERAFNELLRAEAEAAEDPERLRGLERERARLRKRNSRLCQRHGLESRRDRKRKEGRA